MLKKSLFFSKNPRILLRFNSSLYKAGKHKRPSNEKHVRLRKDTICRLMSGRPFESIVKNYKNKSLCLKLHLCRAVLESAFNAHRELD